MSGGEVLEGDVCYCFCSHGVYFRLDSNVVEEDKDPCVDKYRSYRHGGGWYIDVGFTGLFGKLGRRGPIYCRGTGDMVFKGDVM